MKKFIRNLSLVVIMISAIGGQPVLAAEYDLNTYVYNHLENWDTKFEIDYYNGDVIDVLRDIAKKDDYLAMSLDKLVYDKRGNVPTLEVTYKTTKEQEKYINNELGKVTQSIITGNMSDYAKVKAINDYLVNRFQYDYSLKSNNVYLALTTGKTICEGYAMTAYKMLNLAGVENKIIIGKINGVGHAWNLVDINNKWYHLDITNDDVVGSDEFLLKSDKVLEGKKFTWDEGEYPKCDEDYDVASENINSFKSNSNGNWKLSNNLWYFIKNNGTYAVGWNIIDSNWYYLGNDGAMQTGWILSNGRWYYCYPGSGEMAVNTIIDGYKVDSSGVWIG